MFRAFKGVLFSTMRSFSCGGTASVISSAAPLVSRFAIVSASRMGVGLALCFSFGLMYGYRQWKVPFVFKDDLNARSDQIFNIDQIVGFTFVAKSDGNPFFTGATRSTDSMNIAF